MIYDVEKSIYINIPWNTYIYNYIVYICIYIYTNMKYNIYITVYTLYTKYTWIHVYIYIY